MLYLITRWIINALVLMLLPILISGIEIKNFYTALITALVLGLVNAVIRPLIILLTLPINLITLGFFTLIINALLFWFVSSFVKGFEIASFEPAFWGALIYSIITGIISFLLREKTTQ